MSKSWLFESWKAGERRQERSIKRLVGEGQERRKDGRGCGRRKMPEHRASPLGADGTLEPRAQDNGSEQREAAAACAAGTDTPSQPQNTAEGELADKYRAGE